MANPGASAPSSYTVNYDALLTTTLFNYRPVMVDNIFKANAFLAALKKYGGIRYVNGGERIQELLMYEANDTFHTYKGYNTLVVKPQEGMTSAFFEWVEIGGTITISRREKRQNSGESAILNLLEQKVKQAEMSIKAKVNQQILQGTVSAATFVPGTDTVTGALELNPLGYFLPKDPTADPVSGGNLGNISRSTYAWWRPRVAPFDTTVSTNKDFALSVSNWSGLKVGLHRMYNYTSRGADGSAANLVVTHQEIAESYENALDALKRYTDDGLASMGFDNVKLKGATLVWDELVPDIDNGTTALTEGTAFFLNTEFFKLCIDKETDFITTPFVEPENQTASTAKVLFMGQTTVNNIRKHGCCYGIDIDMTS